MIGHALWRRPVAYNGGPMPLVDRSRAFGLPVGYLVIEAIGGALLALLYARFVPLLPSPGPAGSTGKEHGSA